jgi:hypothetical protein
MLLAGIQAKFRLDPRLKHSGVTPGENFLAFYLEELSKGLAIRL